MRYLHEGSGLHDRSVRVRLLSSAAVGYSFVPAVTPSLITKLLTSSEFLGQSEMRRKPITSKIGKQAF